MTRTCEETGNTIKRAIDLRIGDVIRADGGSCHTVTSWETIPEIAVFFRTDTGHDIEVRWIAALNEYRYELKEA